MNDITLTIQILPAIEAGAVFAWTWILYAIGALLAFLCLYIPVRIYFWIEKWVVFWVKRIFKSHCVAWQNFKNKRRDQ